MIYRLTHLITIVCLFALQFCFIFFLDEEVKELSKGAWGRLILVQYQKTKKFFKMLRLPYLSIANKKLADDDVAILKFKSKYLVAFVEAF
jgi:hypothetical protein